MSLSLSPSPSPSSPSQAKQAWQYDSVAERITDATSLKEKAGGYFKQGKHALALKLYKRASEIVDESHLKKDEDEEQAKEIRVTLHLNMAACYLKLNKAGEAIVECNKVSHQCNICKLVKNLHIPQS